MYLPVAYRNSLGTFITGTTVPVLTVHTVPYLPTYLPIFDLVLSGVLQTVPQD